MIISVTPFKVVVSNPSGNNMHYPERFAGRVLIVADNGKGISL